MADFPAAGALENATITKGEMKTALEDFLAASKQSIGGSAESAPVIASGVITASAPILKVRTEAAAATDNLDNIAVTNYHAGAVVMVSAYSASEVVTLRHEQGGSGQISLADDAALVLDDPATCIVLALNGTTWEEKLRCNPRALLNHTEAKSGAYTVALADRGKLFLVSAASGWALSLPAPASLGAGFSFAAKKTDNNVNAITLTPASGTIDGAATLALDEYNDYVIVTTDGNNYYTLSLKETSTTPLVSTTTSSVTETSSTPAATGLSKSITPSSSSHRIKCEVALNCLVARSSGNEGQTGYVHLFRGATEIARRTLRFTSEYTNAEQHSFDVSFHFFDAPATTSSTTYSVKISSNPTTGSAGITSCYSNDVGSLTLTQYPPEA